MSRDPGLDSLLDDARRCLADGRFRAAEDAFGRVLLHDPAHVGAREGRARAAAALAEERRRLDAVLEAARAAIEAGDAPRARALAQEVLRGGGDRDAALHLLDRLETAARPGIVLDSGDTGSFASSPVLAPHPLQRRPWRRAVTAAWALAFALLAAVAVSGWESHVARLTGTPLPGSRLAPPATHYTAPSQGERALADARAHIDRGDARQALIALDRVRPEDPAYPLAQQLRAQADRTLMTRAPQ
jgi:tetratricopeptide (TPR) repeat protein